MSSVCGGQNTSQKIYCCACFKPFGHFSSSLIDCIAFRCVALRCVMVIFRQKKAHISGLLSIGIDCLIWLRGPDLNRRPSTPRTLGHTSPHVIHAMRAGLTFSGERLVQHRAQRVVPTWSPAQPRSPTRQERLKRARAPRVFQPIGCSPVSPQTGCGSPRGCAAWLPR